MSNFYKSYSYDREGHDVSAIETFDCSFILYHELCNQPYIVKKIDTAQL